VTQRLVYKGTTTTTFMGINAELNPGDEFSVADDQVDSFLQRSDIERATDHQMSEPDDPKTDAEPAPKPKKAAQSEPAA
jgi:hypothetical protein